MPTSAQPPLPGNGLVVDADGISLDVNPADSTIVVSGSGVKVGAVAGSNMPASVQTRYRDLCALMEPLAIEALQIGAFSYAVSAGATKYLLSGWNLSIGLSGRIDTRDVHHIFPLSGVTLRGNSGVSPRSGAALIDPTLPTYTDAFTLYHTRLNYLAQNTPVYLPITSIAVRTFLPGPYGAIILNVSNFDFAWIALRTPFGDTTDLPLQYEVSDALAVRYSDALTFPVSKYICSGVESYDGGGGAGSLFYINLPSTWGAVADPNTYLFRDDFMGASLDTASVWNRSNTGGTVEIDTAFQWCKVVGDTTWGHNGLYSKTSVLPANGRVFMCDVFTPFAGGVITFIVGFHDGGGYSYTNLAHGVYFANGPQHVYIFENGTNRKDIGAYSVGAIYRVRITIQSTTTQAKYEMQGGTEFAALGGSTWTDVSPVTSSSASTPLYAGCAAQNAINHYWGDPKIY